jgi:hypothetical protein
VGLDGTLLSNFSVHRGVINVDPSSSPLNARAQRPAGEKREPAVRWSGMLGSLSLEALAAAAV